MYCVEPLLELSNPLSTLMIHTESHAFRCNIIHADTYIYMYIHTSMRVQ